MYACSNPDDFKKPFHESAMKKVVDSWINSILLIITLPPRPQKTSSVVAIGRTDKAQSQQGEAGGRGDEEVIPDLQPSCALSGTTQDQSSERNEEGERKETEQSTKDDEEEDIGRRVVLKVVEEKEEEQEQGEGSQSKDRPRQRG